MAATVQGSHLKKVYNLGDEPVYALNDVSLEVNPGEMVAIVGTPSSGKSTLLHVLGCLQRPDEGQVLIENQEVTRLEDDELASLRVRKVGFLFQAFNLIPNETVLENVEVALRHQELEAREIRRRAEDALKVVGLYGRLSRTIGEISARQRQCVALARAMVNGPAIIFADDPTRALDSSSREELLGLFQRLNDAGMTIVIATPETGVAAYCRRVISITDGRIVDEGMVSKRRVIPPSRTPGPPPDSFIREPETVCPRCNHGNSTDVEICQRCKFPLRLTREEEQSIEGRITGAEVRQLGVESDTDEGDVPAPGIVEELSRVPFFAELASKSLVKILPALEGRISPKGATIVKQGDEGDSFYIVRSGSVQVVLEREGRPDVPVAVLGPGEGFGEMALLTGGQRRSATVIASTDTEAWCLSRQGFEELLSENLSLSLYFTRIMTRRITAMQEKIVP